MNDALKLIFDERNRQIGVKHFSRTHDDMHVNSELAMAAAAYAIPEEVIKGPNDVWISDREELWPFDFEFWNPSLDRIRELVKAGALIVAEIERLQRLKGKEVQDGK